MSRSSTTYSAPAVSERRRNKYTKHYVRFSADDEKTTSVDEIISMMPLMDDQMDGEETDLIKRRRQRQRSHGLCWFICGGWKQLCVRCLEGLFNKCRRKRELRPRVVMLGKPNSHESFPKNVVRNQKYSFITFIPLVLYGQFKFFLNLYFLIIALSQFIPAIKVNYLFTYWGPLGFVLGVTMLREALDDFRRFCRDKESNSKKYKKLTRKGIIQVPSSSIQVSDLIIVEKNQRVPADMVLLRTTEKNGASFIRTDQLDGETDWKLRIAVNSTQKLESDEDLFEISAHVYAEKPQLDIHSFIGTFTKNDAMKEEDSLSIENTIWSNTVVASGTAIGVVVYTGSETRSVMNTALPTSKIGLLDLEINTLTKILFIFLVILSIVLMILKGFGGPWYVYLSRFIILFSSIIPISMRVNLDMGKVVYSWFMSHDKSIPGTVVRSSTIPEELGRIVYLLTDKTGTLTQNEMIFKKLHLGTVSFASDSMDEIATCMHSIYHGQQSSSAAGPSTGSTPSKKSQQASKLRRTFVTKIHDAVMAIALCHNVTPVYEVTSEGGEGEEENDCTEADRQAQEVTYQASSPDEVALVSWTESVGLALIYRDLNSMKLRTPVGTTVSYTILQIFPFTSETKRMGVILRNDATGEIIFYMKGADVVMANVVQYNDWLDEECGNMAREGLRTLVVARKTLTEEQYQDFDGRYNQAKLSVHDRAMKVSAVIESLQRDMELLCLTGVEDKLQVDVRPTLESVRNAGIKIWMITGDKLETATCIAKSSRLVSKSQDIHIFKEVMNRAEAHLELNNFRRKSDCALVITGRSLEVCLQYYEHEFVELACQCPAVVCCRCSPTQKADIVRLLQVHTGKRTCAVGDGGNDVSMIQAADAGVGIVGKEGKQASLAADFSITQFKHIGRLLIVHGRSSYKRSAALSQFVIHRGLIISVMQAVFSAVFYFSSITLYQGVLLVGYATFYTMFPVFSMVLDQDVTPEIAMTYPELYKDLTKGRSLSMKTFMIWVLVSIYQGSILMFGALLLFVDEFVHIVAISFTALILTELLMVALTIQTWHWLMVVAEVISLGLYVTSMVVLKDYFEPEFIGTFGFLWKVVVIVLISCLPLYVLKYLRKKFSPPSYSKLT